MRITLLLATLATCASSLAQIIPGISASLPASIPLGGNFSVTVSQGHSGGIIATQTLLIGISPCETADCTTALAAVGPGTTLYSGAFEPAEDTDSETFALSLPVGAEAQAGTNVITLLQIGFVQPPGADLVSFFQYANSLVTVTVD